MQNSVNGKTVYHWLMTALEAQRANRNFPLTHEQLMQVWGLASKDSVNGRIRRLEQEGAVERNPSNHGQVRFVDFQPSHE